MTTMAVHAPNCPCDAYACRLRRSVQINTGAAKSQLRGRPGTNAEYNGWERGYATEERPGGARMPILNEKGNRMRMKEATERAHEITELRRRRAAVTTQGD